MRCRRSLAVSAVSSRGRGRDARTLAGKVDGKDMLLGNVESQHRPATQLSTHANAFCERLIGSIRRECLDFLIPLNDRHLRGILKEWEALSHLPCGREGRILLKSQQNRIWRGTTVSHDVVEPDALSQIVEQLCCFSFSIRQTRGEWLGPDSRLTFNCICHW